MTYSIRDLPYDILPVIASVILGFIIYWLNLSFFVKGISIYVIITLIPIVILLRILGSKKIGRNGLILAIMGLIACFLFIGYMQITQAPERADGTNMTPTPTASIPPSLTPTNMVTTTSLPISESKVSVMGVDYIFVWNNGLLYSRHYFDILSDMGGFSVNPGATFTHDIKLKSHAWTLSHTIDDIRIKTDGFILLNISPPLSSEEITTGSTVIKRLTIRAPNSEYNGSLEIEIVST